MKLSELWIRNFLYIKKYSSNKLYNALNKSGLEINKITYISKNIKKAITGKIISYCLYNKNLFLLNIDIGKKNSIEIICKKNNFIINSIIVVIYLINKLKEVKKILYSLYYLKINNNNNILILPSNTKLGLNVVKLLNLKDKILDINIPNNRLDCFNILNIVKEISLVSNFKLNFSDYKICKKFEYNLCIDIKNNNICSKYIGVIIKNINLNNKISFEIEEKLKRSDFILKDNIENIINYILLETGYYINIFNEKCIKDNNLIIKINEKNINCLNNSNIDNNIIKIYKKSLVISNKEKILYIPGTGIYVNKSNLYENNIFIGCGSFNDNLLKNNYIKYNNFKNINRRKEIETDSNLIEKIINYSTKLIINNFGGYSSNLLINNNIKYNKYKIINIYINKLYNFLGFNISLKNIIKILDRINFKFKLINDFLIKIYIPNYRLDINTYEDLFEEIIKVYGYNKINKLDFNKLKIKFDKKIELRNNNINKIKTFLIYNKYYEVLTYSFINKSNQDYIYNDNYNVNLLNSTSQNISCIRRSLLIGLLNVTKYNIRRKNNNIRIFEIGHCFENDKNNLILEKNILSGIIHNNKNDINDFYKTKEYIENIILFYLNLYDFKFQISYNKIFENKKSLLIKNLINNNLIGYIGYINNNIKNKFNIKNDILFFEIYLDNLIFNKKFNINKISNLPIIIRDISILLNINYDINDILIYLNKIKDINITNLKVIDYYSSNNIKIDNFNSFTIRFYIQNKKNIINNEINNIINNYIKKLIIKFNIKLRH